MMGFNFEGRVIKNVLVYMAMKEEMAPFVERHGLKQVKLPSQLFPDSVPFECFQGTISKMSVSIIWSGRSKRFGSNNVATTAAAVGSYAGILAVKPDLVISCGLAGGISHLGASLGDVYISTKCVFHSRSILNSGFFEEYGFGHYRSPPLVRLADTVAAKLGVVSSSDALDCDEASLQIMLSNGAAVKEMESAAIAWVCQSLQVPFFALKYITDIVDDPRKIVEGTDSTFREFSGNVSSGADVLCDKLSRVICEMYGKSLDYWSVLMPTSKI